MNGWICLHRKIRESAVFQDDALFRLWCLCLLLTNHRPRWVKVDGLASPVEIQRGQFITGRFALHAAFYLNSRNQPKSPSTVWRMLETLRDMGNLTIKTNNRYSLVSIVNYEVYQQSDGKIEQPDEQPVNSRCTAGEQPVNTNNKNNNSNNENTQSRKRPGDGLSFSEFQEAWNATPGVRKCINPKNRTKAFKARLGEPIFCENWKAVLARFPLPLHASDPDGWKPDADWFLRPNTVTAILEGKYDWTKNNGSASPDSQTQPDDYA